MIKNNLNALCPYFAMYPLDYPMDMLAKYGGSTILDPFCGRGTTNVAARINGVYSVGIDSSRVAFAISSAKMVNVESDLIRQACEDILGENREAEVPQGEFWQMMFDPSVLQDLCNLREALLENCSSPERIALRGLLLGALHGPLKTDGTTSYLSNQFPRTYASKPAYSVRYWKNKGLVKPPRVNVLDTVELRIKRYYAEDYPADPGFIVLGDSTKSETFECVKSTLGQRELFETIITSPPYHGMNSYIPDQWLRNWFVGGPDHVQYVAEGQTSGGLKTFIGQLRSVWKNCEDVCKPNANLCIRFGDIGSKEVDPQETILKTFDGLSWTDIEIVGAGEPMYHHRASNTFAIENLRDYREIDVHAVLT